jgi:lysophospholipase L1-like esterase
LADGTKANKDGLSYVRSDYGEQDGTHPAPSGREKVATRLLQFLKTDPTAQGWFTAQQ